MNNIELFINKHNLPLPLSQEETLNLLQEAKNGSKEAREKIMLHNIRLVLHVVRKYFPQVCYDKKDLVSIGIMGLFKAIDTYDISKETSFATYASKGIRLEILGTLRNFKELKYEESFNNVIFCDTSSSEITFEDNFFDEYNFVEEYEKVETYKIINELIAQLPEREQEIVKLYFGFYNNKTYYQQEIADKFHISRQRIGKIIETTVEKLGNQLEAKGVIEIHKK